MEIAHSGNLYDNVRIDIQKAHRDFVRNDNGAFRKRSRLVTGVLLKTGFWKRLVEAGFIRDWFDEFCRYWNICLGCRPLHLHDFFWLHSHYRTKFQSVEVAEGADEQKSLDAWQQPENIYLCFAAAYRNALSPLMGYFNYLKTARRVLEYGCGAAPITYSAVKYGNFKATRFTIADIQQFTYHFAKWRFSSCRNVDFFDISPGAVPSFPEKYDVVFLLAVLEHLNNPLEVIANISNHMESGGYLIFDYIKSHGHGLDTMQSQRERPAVLEYVQEHFEIIKGKIDKDKSMGSTVARKK